MAKRNTAKTIGIVLLAGIVGLGLLGSQSIFGLFGENSSQQRSTRDIALSCTTDLLTRFHIHPELEIFVNGAKQEVPANIGITFSCMHPLHTHDTAGTIHVESPEERDFTLADFFAVWERPFSRTELLDCKGTVTMTVDGKEDISYENLVFKDKQKIALSCTSSS
jgi:hypothetical protein